MSNDTVLRLKSDGTCRRVIGVWGDKSCPELPAQVHCRNCPVYAETGKRLLDRDTGAEPAAAAQTNGEANDTGRSEGANRSVIVFRAGREWLALPTNLAREVVNTTPAHRVPHRNDPRFEGLINVRGELLPRVDICAMFKIPASAPNGFDNAERNRWNRMLILERDGQAWALAVDEVEGVHQIPEDELRTPPVTVELGSPRFTEATFDLAMGRVGLIDADLFWYALAEVCQ